MSTRTVDISKILALTHRHYRKKWGPILIHFIEGSPAVSSRRKRVAAVHTVIYRAGGTRGGRGQLLPPQIFADQLTLFQTEGQIIKKGIVLKVSKSRKQIILSSHTPKKQQKNSHFFALASKSGRIKKIKVFYCVQ